MKLILNPTKPIYWDKNNKIFRCGNFPETGKEINYDEDMFAYIFLTMKTFIEKKELQSIALNKYKIDENEFDSVINYLLDEKFIISEDDYNQLLSSKNYNRQNLYFYMMSNEYKEVKNFKDKKILILGLGGIGSIVAELLVRSGFCNIILVDFDKVEQSNLNRQLAYSYENVGEFKTDALEKRLISINKKCKIKKYNIEITKISDIEKQINESDFVVCTLDKPVRKIRRIINDVCIKYLKPVIFSGFAEHVGMIGPFVIPKQTACLNCIDKHMKEELINDIQNVPSYGCLCNIIASIVSNEVINYYVKYNENNLEGCTLMLNMYNYGIEKIKWEKDDNCKKCGDLDDGK